jgi:uncharacterized cupredoxin-like copper-binding protein
MFRHAIARQLVLVGLVLVGVALTGCASSTGSDSAGMMGGGPGSGSNGSGMNGGGSGYQYSRLSCSAPSSLPGHTVQVTLADMGMTQMMSGIAPTGAHMMLHATPATVPAGQVSLVASNMGWRTHELVILPLGAVGIAGQRIAGSDGKVPETGSLGEASGSCAAGPGSGIPAEKVGWVTVTLAAGTYELVCNLPNHYADGMYQELVVT